MRRVKLADGRHCGHNWTAAALWWTNCRLDINSAISLYESLPRWSGDGSDGCSINTHWPTDTTLNETLYQESTWNAVIRTAVLYPQILSEYTGLHYIKGRVFVVVKADSVGCSKLYHLAVCHSRVAMVISKQQHQQHLASLH